jgi:hypothetical protein
VSNGQSHLSRVELGSIFSKSSAISQVHEQLTSSDESHDEEDLLVSLEHIVHTNQEGMISLEQDFFFQLCAFYLVIIDDHILSQRLHGINFL